MNFSSGVVEPLLTARDAFFVAFGLVLGVSILVAHQIRKERRQQPAQEPADRVVARIRAVEGILNIVVKRTLSPDKFVVLLFGPGAPPPNDPPDALHVRVWRIRTELRSKLEGFSFVVAFGEDIPKAIEQNTVLAALNIEITEKVLAVRAATIVMLACSIGSATELGIISQHDVLSAKSVIAIHKQQPGAFMLAGAARTAESRGARVIYYDDGHLEKEDENLADTLFELVLQKYQSVLSHSLLTSPERIV